MAERINTNNKCNTLCCDGFASKTYPSPSPQGKQKTMNIKCYICGRTFDVGSIIIVDGETRFCSWLCYNLNQEQKRERELKLKQNLQHLAERGEIICQK